MCSLVITGDWVKRIYSNNVKTVIVTRICPKIANAAKIDAKRFEWIAKFMHIIRFVVVQKKKIDPFAIDSPSHPNVIINAAFNSMAFSFYSANSTMWNTTVNCIHRLDPINENVYYNV